MELEGSVQNGVGGKCEKWSWRKVCEMELQGNVRSGAGVGVKCEKCKLREV